MGAGESYVKENRTAGDLSDVFRSRANIIIKFIYLIISRI